MYVSELVDAMEEGKIFMPVHTIAADKIYNRCGKGKKKCL